MVGNPPPQDLLADLAAGHKGLPTGHLAAIGRRLPIPEALKASGLLSLIAEDCSFRLHRDRAPDRRWIHAGFVRSRPLRPQDGSV